MALLVRALVATGVNGGVALLVCSTVLWLWTRFHNTIREFGGTRPAFALYILAIGTPLYWMAARLAGLILQSHARRFAIHWLSTAALYGLAFLGGLGWALNASEHGEGADIARLIGALVATYGVLVNSIYLYTLRARSHE
jgi:hypothetical protein